MSERRIAYFDATAEIFLDVVRARCEGIPKDARVFRLELDPPWAGRHEKQNVVRLYIESPELDAIPEGGIIPKLEPICVETDKPRPCACCDAPATHYDEGRGADTCDEHGFDRFGGGR